MNSADAQRALSKVIKQIAGFESELTLEQCTQKFAYDVDLPVAVHDSTTGEPTWTSTMNAGKYMTLDNVRKRVGVDDWTLPKRSFTSINDILAAWNEANYATTERHIESLNIAESDTIYFSENVYRSQDVTKAKNILFCNGVNKSEYLVASQRSGGSTYCMRLQDSGECSNSFDVSWSSSIVSSLFIQDSNNLYECMFCSKLKDKKFCIANMQFEKEEYLRLKQMVLAWLFKTS